MHMIEGRNAASERYSSLSAAPFMAAKPMSKSTFTKSMFVNAEYPKLSKTAIWLWKLKFSLKKIVHRTLAYFGFKSMFTSFMRHGMRTLSDRIPYGVNLKTGEVITFVPVAVHRIANYEPMTPERQIAERLGLSPADYEAVRKIPPGTFRL